MSARLLAVLRILPIALLLVFPRAGDAKPKKSQVFSRLNVTVTERKGAALRLPTPFTILPDEQRAAMYVPETGGVILLRGEDVLHHFPIPTVPADGSSALHDLDASSRFLVGGRWTPDDVTTVELHIFDLESGRSVAHIESRNPHLGGDVDGQARILWRVVVDAETVGVYDPRLGASVPLWVEGTGPVESAGQMAQVRSGIGFGRSDVWIPTSNGEVQRRIGQERSAAEAVANTVFLDGAESLTRGDEFDPRLAFLRMQEPGTSTLLGIFLDTAGRRLFPDPVVLRIDTSDGPVSKNWIQGRHVRIRGDQFYWPVVGLDEIEILRSPLETLLPTTPRSK